MVETLTITIEIDLKQTLMAMSQANNEPLNALMNRLLWVGIRSDHERRENDHEKREGEASVEELKKRPWIQEFLRRYHPDENQKLPCGLTLREYQNLSDWEQEALWNKAFLEELDKGYEEVDVSPNVLTAKQRRNQALVERVKQPGTRRKANHRTKYSN
jgi:hypothetical protein